MTLRTPDSFSAVWGMSGTPATAGSGALAAGAGAALATLGATAAAFAFAPGDEGTPPPGSPVSSSEVERLANSFAAAYADEDAARIQRLLTIDAQRVTPANRQTGRPAVVAAYKSQFASNRTTGFKLDELKTEGGAAGRATAHYTASYADGSASGTMTWDVIRERGKPRISLILARPD